MEKHTFKRCAAIIAACALMTYPFTAVSFSAMADDGVTLWGDANCDGTVDMGDAVIVMQSLANPNKYGVNGTDPNRITEQGIRNADVYENGSSLTSSDSLSIQKYLLHLIRELPESFLPQTENLSLPVPS